MSDDLCFLGQESIQMGQALLMNGSSKEKWSGFLLTPKSTDCCVNTYFSLFIRHENMIHGEITLKYKIHVSQLCLLLLNFTKAMTISLYSGIRTPVEIIPR